MSARGAPSGTSTTRARVSLLLERSESWTIGPVPETRSEARSPERSEPQVRPPERLCPELSVDDQSPALASSCEVRTPPLTDGPHGVESELGPPEHEHELDPAAEWADGDPPVDHEPLPPLRPVVAVVGLAPRCGTSTVARWLAAALALRDAEGSAVVATTAPRGAGALRTPAAARLARALEARSLGPARAAGRLCLVDVDVHSPLAVAATYLAPLVVDLGHGAPPATALSVADHVLLVASPAVEPALATVVGESIAQTGLEPAIVLNRALEDPRWEQRADVVLAESRLAARRAAAGRDARGHVGTVIADLIAAFEVPPWD